MLSYRNDLESNPAAKIYLKHLHCIFTRQEIRIPVFEVNRLGHKLNVFLYVIYGFIILLLDALVLSISQ